MVRVYVSGHLGGFQSLIPQASAFTLVTGNYHSARMFDRPPFTLAHLAQNWIRTRHPEFTVLSPLGAHQLLKQTIAEVLNPVDLAGTTKLWANTIQEVWTRYPDLNPLLQSPEGCSPRSQQLAQVIQRHHQRLTQNKWVDPGFLLWQAIALGISPENLDLLPRDLLIYGYFQPTPAQRALMEAVASDRSAICLLWQDHPLFQPQQQLLTRWQNQGWDVIPLEPPADDGPRDLLVQKFLGGPNIPPSDRIQAQSFPHGEGELRGILEQIKRLIVAENVPTNDIVIVAQEEQTLGPLLLDLAWEYRLPLRLPYTIAIAQTQFGAWVARLLAVIDQDFPFEETAQWLGHPLASTQNRDFWGAVREKRPQGFRPWHTLAKSQLNLDLSVLTPLPKGDRRQWCQWLQDIFKQFQVPQQASQWPREILAHSRFQEGLSALAQGDDGAILDWAQFQEEILQSLDFITTVAYPGRGGIEIHRPQNIMGGQYPYIFVVDATEGHLPPAIADDPILDFHERKQLQHSHGISLPSAMDQAIAHRFSFYGVLQGVTAQLTLSHSHLGHKGIQEIAPPPSSYFELLGLEPQDHHTGIIASGQRLRQEYLRREPWPPMVANDGVLRKAIASQEVELNRLHHRGEAHGGIIGETWDWKNHEFSASELTQLGQCGFKWLAARRWRLRDLDDEGDRLDGSNLGKLYHRTLERLLRCRQDDPQKPITMAEITQAIAEAAHHYRLDQLEDWPLQQKDHGQVIHHLIQSPEFLPQEVTGVAVETGLTGIWQGFPVKGYIDRLDFLGNELQITDYKTGSLPPAGIKDDRGLAKIDLQLPLYETLAAQAHPDKTLRPGRYVSIKGRKNIRRTKSIPTEEELIQASDRLKDQLNQGRYGVEPDRQQEACRYCDFDGLCRWQDPTEEE